MIAFLTLFLSLVAGPQQIELSAGPEVGEVELLLDGVTIGRLRSPPWRLTHDFGLKLVPRELVAIARDGAGQELGRAANSSTSPTRGRGQRSPSRGMGGRGAPGLPGSRWKGWSRRA